MSEPELYYRQIIRLILRTISKRANSILDIGSNNLDLISDLCPPTKMSIDIEKPLIHPAVKAYRQDWLEFKIDEKFDIIGCFQCIEHIGDDKVAEFVSKIMGNAALVLLSVPYKWRKGGDPDHLQDPVDEQKVFGWVGSKPVLSCIVNENSGRCKRLVCLYVNNWDLDLISKIDIAVLKFKILPMQPIRSLLIFFLNKGRKYKRSLRKRFGWS